MNDTLHAGTVIAIPEPFTYLVRLEDGREVQAQPSRLHFGHRPDDLEQVRALQPSAPVTVRLSAADPAEGWLVRTARTEQEWRECDDPATLLETVRATADERTLRRFACACCRAVWDLLPEGPHRRLVEAVEAYADGQAGAVELRVALMRGEDEERSVSGHAEDAEDDPVRGAERGAVAKAVWAARIAAHLPTDGDVFEIALDAGRSCVEAAGLRARAQALAAGEDVPHAQAAAEDAAYTSQAAQVRQLFDNPFRSIKADPN